MDDYRKQFEIFPAMTYINSCSYGALANSVKQAMQQYLDDRGNYGERWQHWVEMLEVLRKDTADLLQANSDEIALTASLSAGLNAFVSGINFTGINTKSKVICTEYDFPTTAHIWHAQKRRGAQIVTVPLEHSETPEQDICDQIDSDTAMVSIPYICYRHGRMLEVEKIISTARKHNALIILDAYQAAGTFDINVRKLDVDVLLGGYLKYLLGTSGMAYMYVRKEVIDQVSPHSSGWFAQEDINAMAIGDNISAESARKYEGGTPDISAIYACIAGLDIIRDMGIGAIEKKIKSLTTQIKQAVIDNDWQLATGNRAHGPMLAIRSKDMYQLVDKLREENIVVSCRDDNIRISPHFYNNSEDIDKLVAGLKKYENLLA
jgi:selenocysteine lyase/cysteine desulfurase